jgi:hypothetical protein
VLSGGNEVENTKSKINKTEKAVNKFHGTESKGRGSRLDRVGVLETSTAGSVKGKGRNRPKNEQSAPVRKGRKFTNTTTASRSAQQAVGARKGLDPSFRQD